MFHFFLVAMPHVEQRLLKMLLVWFPIHLLDISSFKLFHIREPLLSSNFWTHWASDHLIVLHCCKCAPLLKAIVCNPILFVHQNGYRFSYIHHKFLPSAAAAAAAILILRKRWSFWICYQKLYVEYTSSSVESRDFIMWWRGLGRVRDNHLLNQVQVRNC